MSSRLGWFAYVIIYHFNRCCRNEFQLKKRCSSERGDDKRYLGRGSACGQFLKVVGGIVRPQKLSSRRKEKAQR